VVVFAFFQGVGVLAGSSLPTVYNRLAFVGGGW